MKHILLALAVGLASSATAIGGATVPSHLDAAAGKPPCSAKFTKIDGHRAVIARSRRSSQHRWGQRRRTQSLDIRRVGHVRCTERKF
jgi:hypothetical protein